MSASAPSDPKLSVATLLDDCDSLVTPTSLGSSSNTPTSAPPSTLSFSSGEFFNVFLFVGYAVAKGGGQTLFVLPKDSCLYLGSIGGAKVCIKDCIDGRSCGVQSHTTRKAKEAKVEHGTFYLGGNETKVFLNPRLDMDLFSEAQIVTLKTQQFTPIEWMSLVTQILNANYPQWLLLTEDPSSTEEIIMQPLKTPFELAYPTVPML